MTLVLTGMVSWRDLGVGEPLAKALQSARACRRWPGILSFGAVIAMTAVLLVFQLGQPRIFIAMARDGLLPAWAAKVHPRFRTPYVTTILTGIVVGIPAMFVNINEVIEFTNIGTLFAFVLVSVGVIVLRRTDPGRHRPFRCPGVPVLPLLSVVGCGILMAYLPFITWMRFAVWQAAGDRALFPVRPPPQPAGAGRPEEAPHVDAHYEQVMAARERLDEGPPRAYFAYSTILDRAAFEEWRHQHGYDFFDLPAGTRAEALDLGLVYDFPSRWWGGPGRRTRGPGRRRWCTACCSRLPRRTGRSSSTRKAPSRRCASSARSACGPRPGRRLATAFTTAPGRRSVDGPVSPRFVEALVRGARAAGLPEAWIEMLGKGALRRSPR